MTSQTARFMSLPFAGLLAVLLAADTSFGQVAPPTAAPTPSTPAMQYFGRGIRKPIPKPQSRRRQAPQVQPLQLTAGKPFKNIQRPPTISPYLSLDAVETSVGLPNYYMRVLPQMQQQQANQAQAAQLRRLQQQVRTANLPNTMNVSRNGGVPTTGHSSQFLNVGNYFPQTR